MHIVQADAEKEATFNSVVRCSEFTARLGRTRCSRSRHQQWAVYRAAGRRASAGQPHDAIRSITGTERSIPEGRKALGVDNGAYVLLVNEKHSYYIQQVELQDAQGVRLWEWHPPRL